MSVLVNLWTWCSKNIVGPINWNWLVKLYNYGKYYYLTGEDWEKITKLLAADHYVIMIRRKTHLTTYLIGLGGLLKEGKWSYWSHGLLNVEGDVTSREDFRLIESTGTGVHFSPFDKVFDCDSVCLLKPKGFSIDDWTLAMSQAIEDLGKPYDTLFDPNQDAKLSCVELVRNALQAAPDYLEHFPKFEAMVQKYGAVIPQMLYDTDEFEKVLEIRR